MQNLLLSARIKEQCKINKIAIKTLLEQCDMNRNTIYDLEKKGAFPSSDRLSRIADYLNCSVDYLLGRTDAPEVNRKAKPLSIAEQFENADSAKVAAYGESTSIIE